MTHSKNLTYKKGVVLLITLFFITAISVIVLKNLKDTDEFIDVVAINSSLSQMNITVDNVNKEIIGVVKKINDDGNLDDMLENVQMIPLNYGNVKVVINLEEYFFDDKYNLYDKNESLEYKLTEFSDDELFSQNVDDKYTLETMFIKNKPKNKRQIQHVINMYKKETRDEVIDNITDSFIYFEYDGNTSVRFINCKYEIDITGIQSKVDMIFEVGKTQPMKLDISFKR